ncbi:alginate lyase family protein [Roseivirga sp. E12]|uniref:alginate lyase family protein n=1 Tax=Roseivirga sp. E12 TaxID=2819237 RepID=UPI001ABC8EBD|nr:alginate lyase family protein [Roseivirga sp. E12]MBO3699744.1 alginate lyase family protein [Roseivirga sp. E12]
MWSKLKLTFGTVIHLKFVQIFYQVFYKLRNRLKQPQSLANLKGYQTLNESLDLLDYPLVPASSGLNFDNVGNINFTFLNDEYSFEGISVDWNYEGKGKLWNYNLNYFEFLFCSNLEKEKSLQLIQDFCLKWETLEGGLEPYPISLRGINWVKYLSNHKIRNHDIDKCLYKQYQVLLSSLEYHLLANHLLENAFSLLFGSFYFRNEVYYKYASKLLREQLNEQVLQDGAHFERSPMYHQIILFRLLDGINLVKHNSWKSDGLLEFLEEKASHMLAWMKNICTVKGEIPMVKDSAPGIAPDAFALFEYAKILGLESLQHLPLGVSGYRKLSYSNLSMLIDIGEVSPAYQPGHSHADELNFLLWDEGRPILVDTGISTYDKNERRQLERSTSSHNCVYLENDNSSQVWGGFRVANRAKVDLLYDRPSEVYASHTGFVHEGLTIFRSFHVNEQGMEVKSHSKGRRDGKLKMNLHFHPDANVKLQGNQVFLDNIQMTFKGFNEVLEEKYMFANGFNRLESAVRLSLKAFSSNSILITYAD